MAEQSVQSPTQVNAPDERMEMIVRELELALRWQRPCILFAVYSSEYVRADAQSQLENQIIDLGQEIEHIRCYLTIQKLRYHDILDYKIEVDEDILSGTILKLTLQPLVENALYHGIKNKRHGGMITVLARRAENDRVMLEIEDNGVGFTPYRLARIRAAMDDNTEDFSFKESGFGLENVNKRLARYTWKVAYWRTSDQKRRWIGTALSEIELKLRLIKGREFLPTLRDMMRELRFKAAFKHYFKAA